MPTRLPLGLATRAVHGDADPDDPHRAAVPPRYDATTFAYDPARDPGEVGLDPDTAFYTRMGRNPTIRGLERSLAGLHDTEGALAFASGMAAVSAAVLAHGRGGVLVVGEAYGGTLKLLELLAALGLPHRHVDAADAHAALRDAPPALVWTESPANPTLRLVDLAALAEAAHAAGARLVVDNTFATPVLQRPLALGADLVMESATKFLGGHSDLTAGVVFGPAALLAPLGPWRTLLGSTIAPDTATRLARSLRTLPLRVRAASATAARLAAALVDHPAVAAVSHPSLPNHPDHALAAQQMAGGGALLAVTLASAHAAAAFVGALRLIRHAPSLGGVESLACLPVATTHLGHDPAELARRGITPGLVRLSVGLEDADDLWADLSAALDAAAR